MTGWISLYLDVGHHLYAHAGDAVVFDVENEEAAAAVDDGLLLFGEVAFDRQQHAREGLAVLDDGCIFRLVEVGHAEEIVEQGAAFENVGVVAEFTVGFLLLVILVVDVAYDLFEHVLECHDALGAAVLVDNDSDVFLEFAEILEQVVATRARSKARV